MPTRMIMESCICTLNLDKEYLYVAEKVGVCKASAELDLDKNSTILKNGQYITMQIVFRNVEGLEPDICKGFLSSAETYFCPNHPGGNYSCTFRDTVLAINTMIPRLVALISLALKRAFQKMSQQSILLHTCAYNHMRVGTPS